MIAASNYRSYPEIVKDEVSKDEVLGVAETKNALNFRSKSIAIKSGKFEASLTIIKDGRHQIDFAILAESRDSQNLNISTKSS